MIESNHVYTSLTAVKITILTNPPFLWIWASTLFTNVTLPAILVMFLFRNIKIQRVIMLGRYLLPIKFLLSSLEARATAIEIALLTYPPLRLVWLASNSTLIAVPSGQIFLFLIHIKNQRMMVIRRYFLSIWLNNLNYFFLFFFNNLHRENHD